MSDEINKAPAAVGEPDADKLMSVVEELEKMDSALPMNWHRSYFEDSPNYRNWTEEEKHNARVSERRLIRAGRRVGDSSCNAIACVHTDDRDLIDRIVAIRNHLPTLLSAIRRLTAANAERVKERDVAREAIAYLPGTLKCDACDFTLTKSIINAQTGEVDVNPDKAPEACPNDGTLLRRVSYREAFRDACDIGMKHAQDARQLEANLSAAREEAKRLREALEPFVRAFMYVHRDPHADENDPGFREFLDGNEVVPRQMSSEEVLSVGHFRHAALAMESAALSAPAGSQQEGTL